MKKSYLPLFLLILISAIPTYAQEEQTQNKSALILSAYTDTYYSYFTNETEANNLQPYTTVSPRNERFGINVAQVGLSYNSEKIRGNITLHWGDIAETTWSSEFKVIQEANVGLKLANNWWLDAGFFTTHIGTESFLPKNDLLSSTTVATYNEPFYQAGAKLSYEGFKNFYAELWAVNGYNSFLDVNSAKSFGLLLSYNLNEETSITYTNLMGRESADDAPISQFRIYHNLYLNTKFREKIFFILGGDFGSQSNSKAPDYSETALMYNALVTVRYQFSEKWSISGRGEIFKDESGFISGVLPTKNNEIQGLEALGFTLGTEYRPTENAYVRAEARFLEVDENTPFFSSSYNENKRWEVMLTMGLQIDKIFTL